jgi:hypothetical protein
VLYYFYLAVSWAVTEIFIYKECMQTRRNIHHLPVTRATEHKLMMKCVVHYFMRTVGLSGEEEQ